MEEREAREENVGKGGTIKKCCLYPASHSDSVGIRFNNIVCFRESDYIMMMQVLIIRVLF